MKKITILTSLLILFSIGTFTSCKDDGPKILSEYLEAYSWDMYFEYVGKSTELKSVKESYHFGTATFKDGIMTIDFTSENAIYKFTYEVDDEHNTVTIIDEISDSPKAQLINSKIFIKSTVRLKADCDDLYDVDWTTDGKTMVWKNDCYGEKITFNAL